MIKFDEERQNKKLAQLRHREEEDLARTLSVKYGVKYVDLSRVAINTNALIHLSEEKSRAAARTQDKLPRTAAAAAPPGLV